MAITSAYAGKRLLPWISLSLLGIGLLAWRVWQWLNPGGLDPWLEPAAATGLMLTAFLLGLSVFLLHLLNRIDFFAVEELLSTTLLGGLGALTVAVVPDAVIWLGGSWQPTASVEVIYQAITVTWTVAFFIGSGILFMRLVESHGGKPTHTIYRILMGVLIAASVFNFYAAEIPTFFFGLAMVAGGGSGAVPRFSDGMDRPPFQAFPLVGTGLFDGHHGA